MLGLGNPGPRFAHTRHNVGFDAAHTAAEELGVPLRKRLLMPYLWAQADNLAICIPLTFMNLSGSVLPRIVRRLSLAPADVLVVCDNMDLPVGQIRIKRRGSSRAHNGVASVMDALGGGDFPRLYIGVGRPADSSAVVEHVLSPPGDDERDALSGAIAQAGRLIADFRSSSIDDLIAGLSRG